MSRRIIRRRVRNYEGLQPYCYHLEYGFAVTFSLLSIIFTTLHMLWLAEFHLHGISRQNEKVSYMYQRIPIYLKYFEMKFQNYSLHPVYMVVGFNLFQASGMLVFRICCCYNRTVGVYIHGVMTTLALPFGVIGYFIIDKFYKETDWIAPQTSFHSWLGFATFFLTFFQVVTAGIVFVFFRCQFPFTTAVFRSRFTPYHNYIGYSTYLLSMTTTLSGLSHILNFIHPHTYMKSYMDDPMTKDFAFENLAISLGHIKYTHLTFGLSCLIVFYTLIKEDFRFRGRLLTARENEDEDFYDKIGFFRY